MHIALFNCWFIYKVTKAIKDVPVENWALLFLTNADMKADLKIGSKKNSALVSREQFQEFYGYTYASRAQFASGAFVN